MKQDSRGDQLDLAQRPTNYYRLIKKAINQRTRALDQFANQYGLTAGQVSILDFLSTQPHYACNQAQLEAEFNIQRSTVTVLLQRMEQRGLLERHTSPTDARRKVVQVSDKGRKLLPAVTNFIDEEQRQFEQAFSRPEIDSFLKLISFLSDKLVDSLPPL